MATEMNDPDSNMVWAAMARGGSLVHAAHKLEVPSMAAYALSPIGTCRTRRRQLVRWLKTPFIEYVASHTDPDWRRPCDNCVKAVAALGVERMALLLAEEA